MSDNRSFPERLFEAGFTDLVSVIPPGAQLLPSSKISQASVGKAPGRRHASGLWHGYDWRKHEPTIDDVRKWVFEGANVGLRAARFPGVDIDCTNEMIALMIESRVRAVLGPAPVRIGRAPKRLMMYKTDEPFSRMRLHITLADGTKHLVEILGEGQQYLVYGTHPSGKGYHWLHDPTFQPLTVITRDLAGRCLDEVAQLIELNGFGTAEREGDGRRLQREIVGDQDSLLAPSLEALRECVACIPNNYPDRESYITIGYAIKAAVPAADDEEAFDIFSEWCARWDGGVNDPETVRSDWRRMNGAKNVGWGYLADIARGYGYNVAAEEFEVLTDIALAPALEPAPMYSDQWLADYVFEDTKGELRFIPLTGKWIVWKGARWEIDENLQHESIVQKCLRKISAKAIRTGVTPAQQRQAEQTAVRLNSIHTVTNVLRILRANPAVAMPVSALDHDPWILNTPGGIVDLTSGKVSASDPDALATRITAVPPDFTGPAPEFHRFLAEATGGDQALEGYLQRYAGYCLTGSTKEQNFVFLYGPGGNGKTVFLNTIRKILGDYAQVATLDVFTASHNDKHSTDLAMLRGARLVAVEESDAGKRWDEQKIKAVTGGGDISARFMHKDNFIFTPQFKLFFTGNHQPEIRNVDDAMRRRVNMVPFVVKPAHPDADLERKLKLEWPAILAWMIEGALQWQESGLQPPALVTAATDEYFELEDAYGRWAQECVAKDDEATTTAQELFSSWMEWANPRKEYVGSMKRLTAALRSRGWLQIKEAGTRRAAFQGVRLLTSRTDLSVL